MVDPETGEQWPASAIGRAFENIINENRRNISRLRSELPPLSPDSGIVKRTYTPGMISFSPEDMQLRAPARGVYCEKSARLGEIMGSKEARVAYEEGLEAARNGVPREENPTPLRQMQILSYT